MTFEYPRYTYNDYKNWKDDWQLINGFPFQLTYNSFEHSKAQGNLIYQVAKSLEDNKKCQTYFGLDWKINNYTIVRPDLMIVNQTITTDFLEFPPMLIAEILTSNTLKTDRVIKFELYRENGVKYYLMVDCLKENIEVYELIDNYYKQVEKSKFKLDKTCEVEFDFDKIWK